ncbi:hypothetical protein [Ilumatobacter sp.]|uniref:hypothetical protein n=1 Tax=Ilumatobacter sp. TaxID=1967498 RepID=UPI003AF44826
MAAEERALLRAEPSGRGTRVLAITTGTMGLLAIGLLMMTITPQRSDSPIAISASTTPASITAGLRAPTALAPSGTGRIALRGETTGVLATPIGDGRFALITRASLVDTRRTVIDVRLPSGRLSAGSIVTASDDAVIVALATTEPGHTIARHRPASSEIVTVMASPPITVAYDDVGDLAVEEGTAVLDDHGHLVGICSRSVDDQVRLIEVSPELDAATSVVP